ncbi:MAG TPA: hypothetical protein VHU61_13620 [Solirubrobacteraceae bacterium]|nr:hypothetical protein [Solirubrobacteraceae bacterium]
MPRQRGRWVASLLLVAVVAAVVVIVVSNNDKPASGGSGAGTTATGAATVQRRNLVATDTESGTLSYANSQTVYNRLSGTITWVPAVGRVIHPGQSLFQVDNKPVLLMDGATPAYRDLSSTDTSGPDVYELNRNLVALGCDPDGIVVDDDWQYATTAGIDALQYRLGETETGKLTLGQVVFLPGPQMVQTVDTTVGSTAAASYTPAAEPSLFVDYAKDTSTTGTDTTTTATTDTTTTDTTDTTGTDTTGTTGTGTTTPTTTTQMSTTPKTTTTVSSGDNLSKRTLQALLRLIRQQQRELKAEQRASHAPSSNNAGNNNSGTPTTSKNSGTPTTSGSTGNSGTGNAGNTGTGSSGSGGSGGSGSGGSGGGGSAVAVLATSSTKLVVTVDLSASSQSEATIGEKVTVEMPSGGTVGGHVTAVSPVAQSSSSDDSGAGAGGSGGGAGGSDSGSSTVPVTIELDKRAKGGGLDQASVSVNFVQSKASHVLSVPVTALLATSGSTFAVQQASAPHKLIPVQTGLFAAGFVEISGSGIYPGLKVTDSQG